MASIDRCVRITHIKSIHRAIHRPGTLGNDIRLQHL
ncbi:hypothetical protein FHS02_003472 [Massilia umbonata]|uniref:Uncharacterized protein n=1 Tax=Pseudoduganella umbonata TaxID=864828 RepID=A0A7W5ECE3_9BURK|nr:hypothetical protein [Pseudoduganella umbonata]